MGAYLLQAGRPRCFARHLSAAFIPMPHWQLLIHKRQKPNPSSQTRCPPHKCSEDYFALLFSSEAGKKEECPPLAGVHSCSEEIKFRLYSQSPNPFRPRNGETRAERQTQKGLAVLPFREPEGLGRCILNLPNSYGGGAGGGENL